MNKIIRKIIFFAVIILICSTTLGLSFFNFDNNQEQSASNKTKIDDIEENYNFGKNASDKSGKTYTIYFFPSASYLYLYHEYISGATSVKPEDQFGYKEAIIKSDSSVTYKLSENTGKITYDGSSLSYGDVTYDGAYRKYMGEKFSCSVFEADGGTAYGDGTAYTASQNALTTDKKRTWGIPNDNFTIFETDSDRVEHFNGRNQYSLDRLGSWGDAYYYGNTVSDSSDDNAPTGLIQGESTTRPSDMDDTNTGRYIPIKLTITNELTSSTMESVVGNVFSSMGTLFNGNYLHNYTFTEWTYVKNPDSPSDLDYPYSYISNASNASGEWSANKVGEAFQPKQRDTYFDMLSDLDQYADKNGVIRLYPLFSNGKKTNVDTSTTDSYLLGGGSSQKLKITTTTTTTTSTDEYKYPFFNSDVYNNGDGSFTYTSTDTTGSTTTKSEDLLLSKYINLFSYNNIAISSKTSGLVFSANNIWNSPTNWNKNDDGTLHWKKMYTLDTDYIQDELVSKYGEGLYTFYVIVANYSYQNGPSGSSSNTVETMSKTFDTFYNNIGKQVSSGAFTSLTGKMLVQVDQIDSEMGDYKCSPTVVFFEKINEPQITTTNSEITDVETFIKNNSDSSRNFYRNVNPLYKGEVNDNVYSATGSDLSSTSPYTYIIKNVDLSSRKYFVLSFNKTSSLSSLFNTTGTNEFEYLITNPTNKDNVNEENIYTNAFGENGFIKSSIVDSEIYFELIDDTYLDVYDIIVKYNTNTNKYDIYMRRHNKLFLYVFDSNLTGTTNSFVDHSIVSDNKTKNGELRLFDKEYAENSDVLSTDVSSTSNKGITLDEVIRNYIASQTDTNLLNYRLIDRVTGLVVGYFIEDETNSNTYKFVLNLKMEKNHILYIEKIK